MTFREWMAKKKPEYVDEEYIAGVDGCPYKYGLETEEESTKNCEKKGWECCERCWNREMPKAFTKSDLKDGMVVEYRNGKKRIYINGFLLGLDGYLPLDDYSNNLLIPEDYEGFDIYAVYQIVKGFNLSDILKKTKGLERIWIRPRAIKLTPKEAARKLRELTGNTYEIEED